MAELVAAGLGQAVPGWVCASLYAVRNPYGPPGCTPVVAEMRCPTTTGVSVDTAPTHVLRYWPITGPGADPSRARVRGALDEDRHSCVPGRPALHDTNDVPPVKVCSGRLYFQQRADIAVVGERVRIVAGHPKMPAAPAAARGLITLTRPYGSWCCRPWSTKAAFTALVPRNVGTGPGRCRCGWRGGWCRREGRTAGWLRSE